MDTAKRGLLPALLTVACLWAVIAFACRDKGGAEARKLSIGSPPFSYSGLIVIAKEKGYFARRGLDLQLRQYPTGLAATQAVSRGEVDLSCVADLAFILPALNDPSLRITATIASVQAHEVVARKDAGIASPRDLLGRAVGYTAGTSGEFYLYTFLLDHGIDMDEIEKVPLPPDSLPGALENGQVQAVSTWDTVVYDIVTALGDQVMRWPTQGGQDYFWCIAARLETLEREHEAMRAFYLALLDAEAWMLANQEEARRLISRTWGYEPGFAEHAFAGVSQGLMLSQALVVSLEGAAAWRALQDGTPGAPPRDILRLVAPDGFEQVAPGRVTLYR